MSCTNGRGSGDGEEAAAEDVVAVVGCLTRSNEASIASALGARSTSSSTDAGEELAAAMVVLAVSSASSTLEVCAAFAFAPTLVAKDASARAPSSRIASCSRARCFGMAQFASRIAPKAEVDVAAAGEVVESGGREAKYEVLCTSKEAGEGVDDAALSLFEMLLVLVRLLLVLRLEDAVACFLLLLLLLRCVAEVDAAELDGVGVEVVSDENPR